MNFRFAAIAATALLLGTAALPASAQVGIEVGPSGVGVGVGHERERNRDHDRVIREREVQPERMHRERNHDTVIIQKGNRDRDYDGGRDYDRY